MRRLATLVSAFLVLGTACVKKEIPPPKRPVLAESEAPFVFLGHADPAQAGEQSVRIDRVYYQRGTFEARQGSKVIVEGPPPPSGAHVFHVEPLQFGKEIRARVVLVEGPRQLTAEDLKQLLRDRRKHELRARVKGAELVLLGAVQSVRPVQVKPGVESEHDPNLTLASMSVRETLRGRAEGRQQAFVFAASDDVHWFRSPKPRVAMEALFLLRRNMTGPGAGAWSLLGEGDLLHGEDITLVREIIREGGGR